MAIIPPPQIVLQLRKEINTIYQSTQQIDEQRILTEVAIFADKVAIDEELVRLASHFKAFDDILMTNEPVGRKLDFLIQEINREINTTGSKCNDADIAKVLNVSMESLLDERMTNLARERSYEYGLPTYLQHDLDAYKDAVSKKSSLIDCYWGELYGSINVAEISDGAITSEHANYLRQKFLWRK
mgnify:CR=1 FL=1